MDEQRRHRHPRTSGSSAAHRPGRLRPSDARIIGGGVVLSLVATCAGYGAALAGEPTDEPDPTPGTRALVVAPAQGEEPTAGEVELAAAIFEDRFAALGIAADAQAGDDGRITVQVALDADQPVVERVLGTVGVVEFTPVPPGCIEVVVENEPMPECLVESEPLFDGTQISVASMDQDEQTGETILYLEMEEAGARLFDEHAAGHVGDHFAIVLDGNVQSAPSINAGSFGGSAQISGDFTVEEAAALVSALAAGRSLPYATSVTSEAD